MFSTRPPQSRSNALGRIRRKIAIHFTASHGSMNPAVAELRPRARVEQVDRDRGRIDLRELERHLHALGARLPEVEDAADAGLEPRLAHGVDRAQPAS